MGQQGRDCDWMGVWNEYKLKQQNYMSKLISKTVHSLPQSPTASIPSPSPPWKAHHPQSTRFYTEQPAKDEHERQGQDNCSSSVEVASFSCERLCQACEAEEAGVECLGCGAVGLCAGCFQRLHARGKFVGHRWKKLTPGINPESLNTLSIPIPQPPHSQPIPRSPRSRNCLPQKENKIPPHQLPQLLQNELTSFNIKYQAYINEISSQALRVRNKWRQFQEVIEGEIQGLRAAVLGGIGKLRERDLGDVQGRFGELERVRLEVQKYQQGQAKALNEGQLWEKVRNCNLKMADSQEMKALMLQRSSLDCKTTCNIRPISNQIKKLLGKINLTENNSIPRQDYSVLVDSRLSQPLDQSIINIKKPKLQKPRPLQKKKQKRQNTTANTSLNSSFLLVLSEPDHKNGKIKKVKSQSTIPLQPMKHTPIHEDKQTQQNRGSFRSINQMSHVLFLVLVLFFYISTQISYRQYQFMFLSGQAHLHLDRAQRACFFIKVVMIWSARLNFFLIGSSSSLNPISSFNFILSKRVCFFVNTSPRQYLAAFSLNSSLSYLSRGSSWSSEQSNWYPNFFSHLQTVFIIEFFQISFGGVVWFCR